MYNKILTFLQSHFFFPMLSSSKTMELCFFFHFQRTDVKNNRCFSCLSLISIILWEYCENNIKTFSCYSYGNKWIISRKVKILFSLRLFKASPPVRWYDIYSQKNIRENKLILQVETKLYKFEQKFFIMTEFR